MFGIDFGTTNSSVARADEQGRVELVQFPAAGGLLAATLAALLIRRLQLGAILREE